MLDLGLHFHAGYPLSKNKLLRYICLLVSFKLHLLLCVQTSPLFPANQTNKQTKKQTNKQTKKKALLNQYSCTSKLLMSTKSLARQNESFHVVFGYLRKIKYISTGYCLNRSYSTNSAFKLVVLYWASNLTKRGLPCFLEQYFNYLFPFPFVLSCFVPYFFV